MSEVAIYDLKVDKEWAVKLRVRKTIALGEEDIKVTSAEIAVEIMKKAFEIDSLTEEYMLLLCTDTVGNIKGLFEVSHGTVKGTMINMRGIFQRALLCNAANIILVHNHPSGDCSPSRQDEQAYRSVKQAGEIMEIDLVDFIIIGHGYHSYAKAKDSD